MKLFEGQSAAEFYTFFETVKEEHSCYGAYCEFCSYLNHGTHVSGIIGATVNNGNTVDGVCNNCDIMFANQWTYEYEDGEFYRYSSAYGFSYNLCQLVLSGTKVINYSVGAQSYSVGHDIDEYANNYMNSIFQQLEEAGYDFVFVKAAGNASLSAESDLFVTYLKAGEYSSKHTLVVGSIQNSMSVAGENGELCYNFSGFSNYGPLVDVAAPGSDIYNTYSMDKYGYMSGTSMAAPHVAGVVALMYNVNPNITSEQVIEIVKNCASTYAVKNGVLYPVIDAELCVKEALELAGTQELVDYESNAPENVGFLTGYIEDALTGDPLSTVTLALQNANGNVYFTTTNENGEYEIALEPGTYSLAVISDDYQYETMFDIEVTEGYSTYNPSFSLVEESDETGVVEGSVINAFNADTVSSTLLQFRRGFNNTTGDVVYRCITDIEGKFRVELEPGNYTVEAIVEGYQSNFFTVTVIGGNTIYDQNGSLTPILEEGEVRIVLTWGEYPKDLDSHLTGPNANYPGEQFHVYYSEKSTWDDELDEVAANLDLDDTTSYGPETTTIYLPQDGVYVYTVHDFTNRNADSSTALARSEAVVTIYTSEGTYRLNVPNREGTAWKVFMIRNGHIELINEMSYVYDAHDADYFCQY